MDEHMQGHARQLHAHMSEEASEHYYEQVIDEDEGYGLTVGYQGDDGGSPVRGQVRRRLAGRQR